MSDRVTLSVPASIADAVISVINEADRAIRLHKPFHSPHEGYAILKEEVDEMWMEIKQNDRQRARDECVQVGAMALRFLVDVEDRPACDGQAGRHNTKAAAVRV